MSQRSPTRQTKPSFTPTRSAFLQRKCACGNSASLTGTCGECQKKNLTLRRRATNQNESQVPPIVHEALRSPGQPLDRDTRTFMESRFGREFSQLQAQAQMPTVQTRLSVNQPGDVFEQEAEETANRLMQAPNFGVSRINQPLPSFDFSQVRIHTDAKASQSAEAVNALAYTVGRHIVFGERQYTPKTTAGKKILIHELTHTIQQKSNHNNATTTNAPVGIQRLGKNENIPQDFGCTVPDEPPPGITAEVLFPNAISSLSPLDIQLIDNIVLNWWAAGTREVIRIDGYASLPGKDALNWRLSCERANVVANELINPFDGSPGIPPEYIEIFAQGETNEFGSDANNRRANIFVPSGTQPPSNECTHLNVLPGSAIPTTIGSRGGCRAGDDFTSHDFPTLPTALNLLVAPLRLLSDRSLEYNMDFELDLFAGALGTSLASHFHGGSGSDVIHNPRDPLSVEVDASPTFNNMVAAATNEIARQIAVQALTCNVDWTKFDLNPGTVTLPGLNFNIRNDDTLQLQAVLGGTQGLTIAISNFNIPSGTNRFSATLRFEICDDFGVDETDVDPTNIGHGSPGLRSFWVLQHERPPGHVAFVNTVLVDEPISGTF